MKQFLSLLLSLVLLLSLAACGEKQPESATKPDDTSMTQTPSKATSLTVFSASPALSGTLEEIAAAYRAKTGVTLRLQTQPREAYRSALQTALDQPADTPALFALTGYDDFDAVSDRCADLKGTALAGFLSDKSLAMTDGDKLLAVPIDVTAYGLLYNADVTDRYFALKNKNTPYASMEEITSFEQLRTLAADMEAHKKELGLDTVFAALPLGKDSSDWLPHAASAAVYADVKPDETLPARAVRGMKDFAFSLGDKVKDAVDLLFTGDKTNRQNADTRTTQDAMKAFATGKAAFFYTGSDRYKALQTIDGSVLQKDKLHFLPLYLGADGENSRGLTVQPTRYLAVNAKASDAQKQAAVDFLEWLFSAEEGKRFVRDSLDFTAPFNTFQPEEQPDDPLRRDTLRYLAKDGVTSVPDFSTAYPGGTLHSDVSSGLLAYTRGERDWDDFKADVKRMWNNAVENGKDLLTIDD